MKRKKKQLNKITTVEFSKHDLSIYQDGSFVLLYKDEILELADMIHQEKLQEIKNKLSD